MNYVECSEHECIFGSILIGMTQNKLSDLYLGNRIDFINPICKRYKIGDIIWCSNDSKRQSIIDCINDDKIDLNIELSLSGTPFQIDVWQALQTIPKGKTATYKEIAVQIGKPNAVRAVGTACKMNPIAIFIPCHRVIGSNGKIGQYRWGTDIKKKLLEREN